MCPINRDSRHHWDLNISSAPLDPNNATLIDMVYAMDSRSGSSDPPTLALAGRLWYDFGPDWGIPYCAVPRSEPRETVTFNYDNESDPGFGGLSGYPIPIEARTNPRYIESSNNPDGDGKIIIVQYDDWWLYELNDVNWDGSSWTAGAGAIWNLEDIANRPYGWTSADAAGMQVLPGLPRWDEVYLSSDPIKHAFRCSLRKINGFVRPARHRRSEDAGGLPMGMRLRLKESFDINAYLVSIGITNVAPYYHRTAMAKILQAMKTYGLIVTDGGGNMYCQGTLDTRWILSGAVRQTYMNLYVRNHDNTKNHFEIIKLGYEGQLGPRTYFTE